MKRRQVSWTVVAVSAALLGLAGCETAPETSGVLDEARTAVSAAEADPNVTRYAPTELDRDDVHLTVNREEDWERAQAMIDVFGAESLDWRRIAALKE